MKLAVGSDERTHVTDAVVAELAKRGHTVELFGPLRDEIVLWHQVALQVAERVVRGDADEGILFCWTGTGVAIAANKVPGIRAALCHDAETAKGARLWNRANVLCLSIRATSEVIAKEILDAWFATPLGTDAVDVECVAAVSEIERKYQKAVGTGQ
jgi:ribose 5-phosphate isomerase B